MTCAQYKVFWLPAESAVDICESTKYLDHLKMLREDKHMDTRGCHSLGEGNRSYVEEVAEAQCASLAASALYQGQIGRPQQGHGSVRVENRSFGDGTHITTVSPRENGN